MSLLKSTSSKKTAKVIAFTALVLFSVYSWMLPISTEFCKMHWFMKIAICGSILCGILFYVFALTLSIKNAKRDKKYYYDIVYASPIAILEIINVLSLFNYELWGYKSVIAGFALFLIMLIEFFACIRALFKKSFGQENVPVILLSLAAISCFFTMVSVSAGNIEHADFFAKACLGLVYLVGIAIYVHQYIYKPKNPDKIVSNIIGVVFWGAFITLTFPYYIQWCGLTSTNFETFVSVYAAVLGGAITLAGVAWTIKDANDKRKEDLQRIENDRIEEDRQKYRPIVHVYAGPFSGVKTDISVFSWLHDTDKISKTATETLTVASRIHSCYFGNTDFSNVYVWGIKINGHMTHFSSIRYIKKESYFYLDFSDKPLYTEKPIETISLILEDVLENLYELPLEHTLSSSFKWHVIQGNNPSFYIGKAKKEGKYEQNTDGEGVSAVHNQSGDRKKWLY